jgi:hypothetical protein
MLKEQVMCGWRYCFRYLQALDGTLIACAGLQGAIASRMVTTFQLLLILSLIWASSFSICNALVSTTKGADTVSQPAAVGDSAFVLQFCSGEFAAVE